MLWNVQGGCKVIPEPLCSHIRTGAGWYDHKEFLACMQIRNSLTCFGDSSSNVQEFEYESYSYGSCEPLYVGIPQK